jgi:hypothetical protein
LLFTQASSDRLYLGDENNKESGYRMFDKERERSNGQPTDPINQNPNVP